MGERALVNFYSDELNFSRKKKELNINCITILAIYRASQYQH